MSHHGEISDIYFKEVTLTLKMLITAYSKLHLALVINDVSSVTATKVKVEELHHILNEKYDTLKAVNEADDQAKRQASGDRRELENEMDMMIMMKEDIDWHDLHFPEPNRVATLESTSQPEGSTPESKGSMAQADATKDQKGTLGRFKVTESVWTI